MIWLSIEETVALGYPRRSQFRHLENLPTRNGAKAANGKHQKEILFSSLPTSIQQRWMEFQMANSKSHIEDAESLIGGVIIGGQPEVARV